MRRVWRHKSVCGGQLAVDNIKITQITILVQRWISTILSMESTDAAEVTVGCRIHLAIEGRSICYGTEGRSLIA